MLFLSLEDQAIGKLHLHEWFSSSAINKALQTGLPAGVPALATVSGGGQCRRGQLCRAAGKLDYLDSTGIEQVRQAYHLPTPRTGASCATAATPHHPSHCRGGPCASWKLDARALMAALLHDAMEDCGITKAI